MVHAPKTLPLPGPASAGAARVGRRQVLARSCNRSGALPLAGRVRDWLRADVRILAYHRVLESSEPEGFGFDLDLVSASASAFEAQMAWVKRKYHPMRFDELAECMASGDKLPERAVLVTFDDGYEDNYRIAYPILKRLGMSAMFFVSTGHVDSGAPFAYDWLVHMVVSTAAGRVELPEIGFAADLPATLAGRRMVASQLLNRIKAFDARAQSEVIGKLALAWGMPCPERDARCCPMTWDQLREMRRGGMEIGSHGIHHRMLAKLPAGEMRMEVAGSRVTIAQQIGVEPIAISYPVGGPDAYDASVASAVREAGYDIACTYQSGTDRATESTRYRMRRLPVERQMDKDWFEAMLAVPEVFAYRSRRRNG